MPAEFTGFKAAELVLRHAFPLDVEWPDVWNELLSTTSVETGLAERSRFGGELASLRGRLLRFASSLGCRPAEAEDLAQDTLMRAWAARSQFEPGTNLRAWTFTILRNRWLSLRRRDRFEAEYDEALAEIVLSEGEHQTAYVELAEVLQVVGALPDDQRAAFESVVLHGLSYEDAAERLLVPLGTLKSRVSRGRAALKEMLEQAGRQRPPTAEQKPDVETETVEPAPMPAGIPPRSAWAHAKANGRSLLIG